MSINPDRINIHELTIEEPEYQTESPFDVERDITEEDWQEMRDVFRAWRGKWGLYFGHAATLKILGPDKDLSLDEEAWQGMKNELQKSKTAMLLYSFWSNLKEMKIIKPEEKLNLDNDDWKKAKEYLENMKIHGHWDTFLPMVICMKIVNPHEKLDIDQATWNTCFQHYERFMKNARSSKQWSLFSDYASRLKISGFKGDLGLDQETWQEMKEELAKYRSNKANTPSFASLAANMKILAAEKVDVTDKGLEVIMPEPKRSLVSDAPPVPETKQF